eukprot:TRINITY_DN51395_c0_g1_i1.p1 TRINITY_DN51395_c0_g1~~TRINITY_DN51395_c0_g1_i1.p1  ORF type:complete len:211 (+),score=21.36 TRINITY_DN51395_c0_g1_i1:59-634(+)
MPFETVEHHSVTRFQVRVCERCRRPLEEGAQRDMCCLACSVFTSFLSSSVGSITGAACGGLFSPTAAGVGALAGALWGGILGAVAGVVMSNLIFNRLQADVCKECQVRGTSAPAGTGDASSGEGGSRAVHPPGFVQVVSGTQRDGHFLHFGGATSQRNTSFVPFAGAGHALNSEGTQENHNRQSSIPSEAR